MAVMFLACAPALPARDAFVLLSGGNSPFDNNYSQYLQGRAVADYFVKRFPSNSVWIFFGAGNVKGEAPILADVCQETVRDNVILPSWLPGALPHNLPARRAVFLTALRNEILPAIADGGTLFLFVGDHGSRTRGRNSESEIDLWSLGRDPGSEHGWHEDEDETLPVSELRSAIASGIGKGRVVFCMTQCHAGGFHYMAIPHEMPANPKWFTDVPDWAVPKNEPVFPTNVAGFTATDEFSMAAGCDPDPDPERWAGYERFVPEGLLGMDLYTLKAKGKCLPSFAEAHAAATMKDMTIDRPASTSDQYLERWANLIEKRLATEPNLTPKVRAAVAAYQHEVDGWPIKSTDAALKERQAQFRRFTEKFCANNVLLTALVHGGTRDLLEQAEKAESDVDMFAGDSVLTNTPANPPRGGRGRGRGGRRRLWRETLRPVWKAAVESNQLASLNLSPAAIEFEKHLLGLEDDGENYFFGANGARAVEEEVYWEAGFAHPLTVDFSRADAITKWGAERHDKIIAWAKTNSALEVRTAAARLQQMSANPGANTMAEDMAHDASPSIDRETAAARTLFYRRVLAAWEFLITVNERPALNRLKQLSEIERTSLPQQ